MMLSNQSCTAYFPANYPGIRDRLDTLNGQTGVLPLLVTVLLRRPV